MMIRTIRTMNEDQKEVLVDVIVLGACLFFLLGYAARAFFAPSTITHTIEDQFIIMKPDERADFLTWAMTAQMRSAMNVSQQELHHPVSQPKKGMTK